MAEWLTRQEFEDYLEGLTSDKDYTPKKAETVLRRAEDIARKVLGFDFEPYQPGQRVIEGTTNNTLILPRYNPGSITAVALLSPSASAATVAATITDYVVDDAGHLFSVWGWMGGAIRGLPVRYLVSAEFGDGPAPEAAKELALEIAVNIWKGKDKGMWQTTAGAAGGGQTLRFTGGLTPQQKDIVAALREEYRPPRFFC